jgi:hypothetical protein
VTEENIRLASVCIEDLYTLSWCDSIIEYVVDQYPKRKPHADPIPESKKEELRNILRDSEYQQYMPPCTISYTEENTTRYMCIPGVIFRVLSLIPRLMTELPPTTIIASEDDISAEFLLLLKLGYVHVVGVDVAADEAVLSRAVTEFWRILHQYPALDLGRLCVYLGCLRPLVTKLAPLWQLPPPSWHHSMLTTGNRELRYPWPLVVMDLPEVLMWTDVISGREPYLETEYKDLTPDREDDDHQIARKLLRAQELDAALNWLETSEARAASTLYLALCERLESVSMDLRGSARSYAGDFAIALHLLSQLVAVSSQALHLSDTIYDRYDDLEIPNYISLSRWKVRVRFSKRPPLAAFLHKVRQDFVFDESFGNSWDALVPA